MWSGLICETRLISNNLCRVRVDKPGFICYCMTSGMKAAAANPTLRGANNSQIKGKIYYLPFIPLNNVAL